MSNVMTKRGSQDNVVTYEHYCDTYEDMKKIDPHDITLGSRCIVLEGKSGKMEVYISNSQKKWKLFAIVNSADNS